VIDPEQAPTELGQSGAIAQGGEKGSVECPIGRKRRHACRHRQVAEAGQEPRAARLLAKTGQDGAQLIEALEGRRVDGPEPMAHDEQFDDGECEKCSRDTSDWQE
jgi:hypothetical protein